MLLLDLESFTFHFLEEDKRERDRGGEGESIFTNQTAPF